jgi:membrane protein YdbS with pleckstrin-like domain
VVPLPRKLLNQDEELLAELRPHWIYFAGPLAGAVCTYAGILVLVLAFHHLPSWTSYPLLILAAIPTVWLLARLARWYTYTLALTSTRILVRQGVFGRDTVQLRLQRITEINLAQALWERILGTGRLIIDVQGEDDSLILEFVRKPAIVQRVVNAQINELVGGGLREQAPIDMVPRDWRPSSRRHGDERDESDEHDGHDDTPPLGTTAVGPDESTESTEPDDSVDSDDATRTSPTYPTPSPMPIPTTGDGGIRDKLVELDELRHRGILTEEEFAAKKAELLDRL